ncbi:MAG: hypothetical protein ABH874_04600 [Methanobacteriota archaeon]
MINMGIAIEEITAKLNLPENKLISESLKAWIEKEIKLAEGDIADLRDRYNVPTKDELDKKIKAGKVHSHPAWEDLITWENLEEHIRWLKDLLKKVD